MVLLNKNNDYLMFLLVPWHEIVIVYECNHILWLSYYISMINAMVITIRLIPVSYTISSKIQNDGFALTECLLFD